jgi:glycerol-3-phosphate cytidylyltransferase-like family protein
MIGCMKSTDSEYLKEITPDIIARNSDPEMISRLLEIIEDLQNEVKRLKRTQGLDLVKGRRQKPMNYIPGKDKI